MTRRTNTALSLAAIVAVSVLGVAVLYWALTAAVIETAGEGAIRPQGNGDNVPLLQQSDAKLRRTLTNAVLGQISALHSNDFARAYDYASMFVQAQFPLPVFERIVRSGYSPLLTATNAEFAGVLDNGRQAVAGLILRGPWPDVKRYEYHLRREGEGWKVTGVMDVPGDLPGVPGKPKREGRHE
ncbi:MAG TPA: DUF4864 domain-containing protein [Verrucomicrobiae bacterium]|nr:DUF4864 domain-containing protein [Verrucomicrobiae bacterium]